MSIMIEFQMCFDQILTAFHLLSEMSPKTDRNMVNRLIIEECIHSFFLVHIDPPRMSYHALIVQNALISQ